MPSHHRLVAETIAFLAERWRTPPPLADLAARVELSPHHFQRVFRRMTGVSPARFVRSLAADDAERRLSQGRSVLETATASTRSGPGRLHDLTVSVRAMTPGELRRGGEGLSIRWGTHASALGACSVAVTERGICELAFDAPDFEPRLRERWPAATLLHEPGATRPVADGLLDASARSGPPTLHLRGTNFQLRVWKALLAIPPGEVTSYGAIASALGRPSAARAVGGAVGKNPVAVLIPCHRVLRAHGALGGYRWGLPRKRALLALERARDSSPR